RLHLEQKAQGVVIDLDLPSPSQALEERLLGSCILSRARLVRVRDVKVRQRGRSARLTRLARELLPIDGAGQGRGRIGRLRRTRPPRPGHQLRQRLTPCALVWGVEEYPIDVKDPTLQAHAICLSLLVGGWKAGSGRPVPPRAHHAPHTRSCGGGCSRR